MTKDTHIGHRIGAVAALSLSLSAGSALAHHPSGATGGSSGPIVTEYADTLDAGNKAFYVTHEYIDLSRLSDETLIEAALEDRDVHSLGIIQSATLAVFYGVTDYLTIGASLPWIRRSEIFEGEVEGAEHHGEEAGHGAEEEEEGEVEAEVEKLGTAEGIGDLWLTAQLRVHHDPQTGDAVSVLGGVKLPTGSTGDKDLEGNTFEAEFQPGSGSVDFELGAAAIHPMGPWALHTSALYIFVQEGTQDIDLGDRFLYNGAVTYRLFGEEQGHHHDSGASPSHGHGPSLDLALELNGEWSKKEVDSGITDPDTGGNTIYLSPGVRVASNGLTGFLSVGAPISNDYNGTQSEPDWRIVSGFSVVLP